MDAEFDGTYTSGEDEVTRQRLKHRAAFLERPVSGFPGMTLGQTVASVVAATEEAEGVLDVQRFLADEGHSWQTIESVLAYLGLDVPLLAE